MQYASSLLFIKGLDSGFRIMTIYEVDEITKLRINLKGLLFALFNFNSVR